MIRSAPTFPTEHLKLHDFMCDGIVWHPIDFPWFNVTLCVGEEHRSSSEVFMISSLDQLKKVLEQQTDSFKVQSIDYVTPGFMNGSGQWRMERLLEISELFNPYGWSIPRCRVDGDRVYKGVRLEPSDEWTIERSVYSRPRPA
jgi:hypothetical protein